MPQANDGELTRLFTVQHGGIVEDPAPNSQLAGVEPSFDLWLEGVAGNVLGTSHGTYTLTITCFDWTAGAAAPKLNPTGQPFAQDFDGPGGPFWFASGPEQVTLQKWTIGGPLPAGLSGHVFIYTASLISVNFDQAWFIQSNPFVLC